jgi:hypothetical protein
MQMQSQESCGYACAAAVPSMHVQNAKHSVVTFVGMPVQGQGLQEEGSMDPDDDLGDDDIKDDDQLTIPYHGAHAHMHSIPHIPHQMGQPVPGTHCHGPVHAAA